MNITSIAKRGAVTVALAGLVAAGTALPAQAALKGYNSTNYSNLLYTAASAAYIDAPDNITSSVRNENTRPFSGRDVQSLVSFEIFYFAANSSYGNLGGADNKLDHFDRR